MAENNEPKTKCISVFKSGESTTTAREFTDKWIELINTLEKGTDTHFARGEIKN